MSDLRRHGHKHETPLRHWLATNLPDDQPFRTSAQTWSLAQRYTAGEPVKRLSDDTGLAVQTILQRLHYLARKLGYQSPGTTSWLLPDGRLASHAVRVDERTGCQLWTGYLAPKATGPYEHLPRTHWPKGHTESPGPRVQIRQYLWERRHGGDPGNLIVATICGDRRCLALDHAHLRVRHTSVSPDDVASTIERKAEESRDEAAVRLGVHPKTIFTWRGPGGRKKVMASPLRAWLWRHLPDHQMANTHDLDDAFARRYVAGESLQSIATGHGVSRQLVQQRIKRLAMTLGYVPGPDSTAGAARTRDQR